MDMFTILLLLGAVGNLDQLDQSKAVRTPLCSTIHNIIQQTCLTSALCALGGRCRLGLGILASDLVSCRLGVTLDIVQVLLQREHGRPAGFGLAHGQHLSPTINAAIKLRSRPISGSQAQEGIRPDLIGNRNTYLRLLHAHEEHDLGLVRFLRLLPAVLVVDVRALRVLEEDSGADEVKHFRGISFAGRLVDCEEDVDLDFAACLARIDRHMAEDVDDSNPVAHFPVFPQLVACGSVQLRPLKTEGLEHVLGLPVVSINGARYHLPSRQAPLPLLDHRCLPCGCQRLDTSWLHRVASR